MKQESKNEVILEINGKRHKLIRLLGDFDGSKTDELCPKCSLKELCRYTFICTDLNNFADFDDNENSNPFYNCFEKV